MNEVIFYSGTRNASSWAMRAWLALRAAELPFEEVVVDIRRPQRYVNLARIGEFSPSATVPVLVVDGRAIFDSIAIMEFANDHCGGRLLPDDLLVRAEARAVIAWQHAGLSAICSRISFESAFYPYKRRLDGGEQAEVARLAGTLEKVLGAHAEDYLYGRPTLADYMLAPTAIRLYRHAPDLSAFPRTARWMRAVNEHALVQEWLAQADPLVPIWYDDYLATAEREGLERSRYGASVELRDG